MSRRIWLIVAYTLGMTALVSLVVMLWFFPLPGSRREWSLQFVPPRVVLPVDLPSVHAVNVLLCNRGTKSENIRLETCCGVEILDSRVRQVEPNECTEIPLNVDVRDAGVYRGALFVRVQGFQSPVAVLPIAAQAYESAVELDNAQRLLRLPPLVRKTIDVASSERCVTVVPRTGFVIEDVVSPVDWLVVRLRRSGKTTNICAKALPSAPEGQFTLDFTLRYRTGTRSGIDNLRAVGLITSMMRIEPTQLFFGVVSLQSKQPVIERAQISFRKDSGQTLSVKAVPSDFTARVVSAHQDGYVVEVRFVPKRLGEIRGYVECRLGDELIYLLPVSAMVEP